MFLLCSWQQFHRAWENVGVAGICSAAVILTYLIFCHLMGGVKRSTSGLGTHPRQRRLGWRVRIERRCRPGLKCHSRGVLFDLAIGLALANVIDG